MIATINIFFCSLDWETPKSCARRIFGRGLTSHRDAFVNWGYFRINFQNGFVWTFAVFLVHELQRQLNNISLLI
jgi:hypothetical protein